MIKRTALFALAATVVGGIVGCESPKPREAQYVAPSEIVSGVPERPTMYDLASSAEMLVEKMLASPLFTKSCNEVKMAKGGALPVIVIGNIANKTTERIQGRLDTVGESVRTALFSSGLFEVKDDAATGAIIARMSDNIDLGLEDGSLARAFGKHATPDFLVLGDFRHFADAGGVHTYRLSIAIHSLRTGKIVWEGIQTRVKL